MKFSPGQRSRYESIPKRDFKTALIRLLETDYKILGSHKVLAMLADDIEQLHQEYFPRKNRLQSGDVVWQTTKDDGQRPSYGKRTEGYAVQTVILPLVRAEDVERRIYFRKGDRNSNYRHREARDIELMVRLLKSAKEQGGLLSGAELSVLMNRTTSTIGKYLKAYFEKTGEILPMKGYVLDQGSNPTHKGIIISLYEQGVSPAHIVLKTGHTQDAVDQYIKTYDQALQLAKKKHNAISISQITGRSLNTINQYVRLINDFHPGLKISVSPKLSRHSTGQKALPQVKEKVTGQMS
jgi:hypothetical protein